MRHSQTPHSGKTQLYTEAERARRDGSVWTLVQGLLAPIQFLVFVVSLVLVLRYLATGNGYEIAADSVVAKTALLMLIMVTGAIWEKVVYGQYLFAPAFFWEDVFSFAVIALHALYIYGLYGTDWSPVTLMIIALAAYATYVVNAGQFILKLRRARLDAVVPA